MKEDSMNRRKENGVNCVDYLLINMFLVTRVTKL